MRKRLIVVFSAVALFVLVNCAMSSNHQAALAWGASPTAGATYNIYKANCLGTITNGVCSQESAFTLIANVPNNSTSYIDQNVTAGANYSYYMTALCDSVSLNCGSSVVGESVPSVHAAVTIPKDQPGAPTNFKATAQ